MEENDHFRLFVSFDLLGLTESIFGPNGLSQLVLGNVELVVIRSTLFYIDLFNNIKSLQRYILIKLGKGH